MLFLVGFIYFWWVSSFLNWSAIVLSTLLALIICYHALLKSSTATLAKKSDVDISRSFCRYSSSNASTPPPPFHALLKSGRTRIPPPLPWRGWLAQRGIWVHRKKDALSGDNYIVVVVRSSLNENYEPGEDINMHLVGVDHLLPRPPKIWYYHLGDKVGHGYLQVFQRVLFLEGVSLLLPCSSPSWNLVERVSLLFSSDGVDLHDVEFEITGKRLSERRQIHSSGCERLSKIKNMNQVKKSILLQKNLHEAKYLIGWLPKEATYK